MLKQILSLVLNCEKKRNRQTDKIEREIDSSGGTSQPINSMGDGSNRQQTKTSQSIPDPWW